MSSGKGFVSQHPWMTFFIALVAISGIVAIADDTAGTIQRVAGPPRNPVGPRLPPKSVS